jgi:hypothetical protein
MRQAAKYSIFLALAVAQTAIGHATSITVNANDVIYAAGTQGALIHQNQVDGQDPTGYPVTPGDILTFAHISGSVSLDNGLTFVDPDGLGINQRVPTSSNLGSGSISGLKAPGEGYLVGVFVAAGGPSGAMPPALDFTSTGIGTSFLSLSPLLDQTFFIGDGLTGDGTGVSQIFHVPTGAGLLYLGISDSGEFNGRPLEYWDNLGTFTIGDPKSLTAPFTETAAATPEPSTLVLLGTGVSAILSGMAVRRRRAA